MANYSFIGYNPTILSVGGGTATLNAAYDPDTDRRVFDVTDGVGGNTLGGANGHPDLGVIFDGDRYDNEDGDDLTQTGNAESLDGSTTYASGKMYLEERYTLTKPGGGTIEVFRVEVDGLLVGYITSEPLVAGTTYPSTTSNVVPLDAPDTTDPGALIDVPCFTSGTMIRTPADETLIDDLKIGDLVTTMDNGPQKIRWIGNRRLNRAALLAQPNIRPILIRKGVLGADADLLVSPQHGILRGEAHLIRAKHLTDTPESKVRIAHGKRDVTYIHLLFDQHQIIFSNGVASESLYPGKQALRTFETAAQDELFSLFPELADFETAGATLDNYGASARTYLKRKALNLSVRL